MTVSLATGSQDLKPAVTLYTVGHSTRTTEEFLQLLAAQRIERLVDVRRFPGSKRHPQFGRVALEDAVTNAGIEYRWMPELGGRRRARPDSKNTGWEHDAFRGYADYMDTPEFASALGALRAAAAERPMAIMCAEALWWQCHRRLISDALVARGDGVLHIRTPGPPEPHVLRPPARIVNGVLSYESPVAELPLED